MKRQEEQDPTEGTNHSSGAPRGCGSRGRKRRAPEVRQSETDSNSVSLTSFSSFGPVIPLGSFPTFQSTGLFHPPSSLGTYLAPTSGAAAGLTAGRTDDELSGLYSGNIAAACEAANQEAAHRQKELSKDGDEDIQRKKAASRITAWQSRERKRIEMEVLQERKTELSRRNSDLRSENKQLRLLITSLKAVLSNPAIPRLFPQINPFVGMTSPWTNSLTSGTAATFSGMTGTGLPNRDGAPIVSSQPSVQSHPFFSAGQPLLGYSFTAGSSPSSQLTVPPFFQEQEQQELRQLQRFGAPSKKLATFQQQLRAQQRPLIQGTNSFLESQGAATNTFLGIHETASPLARQRSTSEAQQVISSDLGRQAMPPYPAQPEDTRGISHMDFASLLVPPGNFHVDVPLIRAVPKRRDFEAMKEDSPEKKKENG